MRLPNIAVDTAGNVPNLEVEVIGVDIPIVGDFVVHTKMRAGPQGCGETLWRPAASARPHSRWQAWREHGATPSLSQAHTSSLSSRSHTRRTVCCCASHLLSCMPAEHCRSDSDAAIGDSRISCFAVPSERSRTLQCGRLAGAGGDDPTTSARPVPSATRCVTRVWSSQRYGRDCLTQQKGSQVHRQSLCAVFGDRLRPQLIELTIFALTLLGPSGGVATNLSWASATRAERKDSSLCACPRERRDNSSTSA